MTQGKRSTVEQRGGGCWVGVKRGGRVKKTSTPKFRAREGSGWGKVRQNSFGGETIVKQNAKVSNQLTREGIG